MPTAAAAASTPFDAQQVLRLGRETFDIEAAALAHMGARLGPAFVQAVQRVLATAGRVIVMGMGKSGHVGRKIAATLASTGTPAFFVHPAEASHGDLGMVAGATWCWPSPTAAKARRSPCCCPCSSARACR